MLDCMQLCGFVHDCQAQPGYCVHICVLIQTSHSAVVCRWSANTHSRAYICMLAQNFLVWSGGDKHMHAFLRTCSCVRQREYAGMPACTIDVHVLSCRAAGSSGVHTLFRSLLWV